MRNLNYVCRQLLNNPGFTAVAVLTLALGIGANTAIFGVLNELLLRPLPLHEPENILGIVLTKERGGFADQNIPYPIIEDYRELSGDIFEEFAAYATTHALIEAGGSSQFGILELATENYFQTLGVSPAAGTFLGTAHDRFAGESVPIILSHSAWKSRFNGEPSVIGKTVDLHPNYAEPVHGTIVGVAPEGFHGLGRTAPELWLPAVLEKHFKDAAKVDFRMIGRLAGDVGRDQAEAALDGVAASIAAKHGGRVIPEYENEGIFRSDLKTELRHAALGSWGAFRSHEPLRRARLLAFGVSGLVLLIACANIANLLLARAEKRRREMAIRLSLGAGRSRILRMTLAESLALSFLGGCAGLVLALAGNRLLLVLKPPEVEMLVRTSLDPRMAAFCLVAALVTGLMVGMWPAWRGSREDPNPALKGNRELTSVTGLRLRDVFAVIQVALSMVLLIGAGLCLRSFSALLIADPGFDAERLIVAQTDFQNVPESRGAVLYRAISERLSAIPGVESVGWSRVFPLLPTGGSISAPVDVIEGYEPGPNEFLMVEFTEVAPGYLETMGMAAVSPPARVIEGAGTLAWANEAFVRRYWPGLNPLGRRVGRWIVEGVVRDARVKNLWDSPTPYLYLETAEPDARSGVFLIRTRGEPAAVLKQVRAALLAQDPGLHLPPLTTMRAALGQTLGAQRFLAVLVGVFAACAVLLAVVGVYGVVSYLVNQRTREIGIRMALGAQRRWIMAHVLKFGGRLTALGLAFGFFGAWTSTKLLRSILFEVSPKDPATFVVVPILLAAAVLLACWWPARRAAHLNPMEALRHE